MIIIIIIIIIILSFFLKITNFPSFTRTVFREDNMFLTSLFRVDEFKDALFQMHLNKSPKIGWL